MALTRITKGVIKPNENYDTHNINSTGIVTAIGLDINGNGDISGNLSVGGVLTYEDVTSIDSVGIITAQKGIHVGAGVSAVGVGTFGSLDIGGDIDVDGHTNLDNVSVAGVTTITSSTYPLNVHADTAYQGILVNGNNAPTIGFNVGDNATPSWKLGLHGGSHLNFALSTGAGNSNKLVVQGASNGGKGLFTGEWYATNLSSHSGLHQYDDTDTRISFGHPSGDTDTINLQTGGSTRLRIENSGVVVTGVSTFSSDLYVAENIIHTGDPDTKIRFTNDVIQLQAGGTNRIQTNNIGARIDTTLLLYGDAGNPGRLRLQEGGALSEIMVARNSDTNSFLYFRTEISGTTATRVVIDESGHFRPFVDSTYDLGITGTRWRNVYADTYYGDGSNLTGISADKIFEGNTKAEVIDTGSNGHFLVETEGTERLKVNGDGIDVSGEIELDNGGSAGLNFKRNGTLKADIEIGSASDELAIRARGSGGFILLSTNSINAFRLNSSGHFDLGRDYSTNPSNGLVGITTIRGHRVNEAGDYAQLYFKNSSVSGGSSASIRAYRDGGNYNTGFSFYTNYDTSSGGDGQERFLINSLGTVVKQTFSSNQTYAANDTTQLGYQSQNLSDVTNTYTALRLTAGNSSPATAQLSSIRTAAGQNDFTIQLEKSNTAFEALRINSDGQIGIGTDTMDSSAEVSITNSTSSARIYMKSADNADCSIIFGSMDDAATGAIRYDHSDDTFNLFGYNNSKRLTIAGTGQVLIGTDTVSTTNLVVYSDGTEDNKPATLYQNSLTGTGAANGFYVGSNHNEKVGYVWNYEASDLTFATSNLERVGITTTGQVNIGGDYHQTTYRLKVTGSFAATTKSFVIDHPTKEKYKLRYACLEGPENSVYVRGKTSDSVIELPDYWTGLVHEDSITVNVTPIGNHKVWVESINNNSVTIGSDGSEYFYTVFAERKDVDKLEVEVAE